MQIKYYLMYGTAVSLLYSVMAWNGVKLPRVSLGSGMPSSGYSSGSGFGGGHYYGGGSGGSSGWNWGK